MISRTFKVKKKAKQFGGELDRFKFGHFFSTFKCTQSEINNGSDDRGVKMLHELLLALLGYTGDLIIDEREQQTSLGIHLSPEASISEERTFKLAPDISFIEPSERLVYIQAHRICLLKCFKLHHL